MMNILPDKPPGRRPPNPFDLNKVLATLASASVAVGVGLGSGFFQSIDDLETQVSPNLDIFTRADYERIEPGMTQVEVESILDPGVEISRSEELTRLIWSNPDGSKITADFENGTLVWKEQLNLE